MLMRRRPSSSTKDAHTWSISACSRAIGEGFLEDAKQLHLRLWTEEALVHARADGQINLDAVVLAIAIQVVRQGRKEGLLPGRRGAQVEDRLAHVGVRFGDRTLQVRELVVRLVQLAIGDQLPGCSHLEAGEA